MTGTTKPQHYLVPADLSKEKQESARRAVCTGGDPDAYGAAMWDFRQILRAVGTPLEGDHAEQIADLARTLQECRKYIGKLHKDLHSQTLEKLAVKEELRAMRRALRQIQECPTTSAPASATRTKRG
ncbi:hypothetical protein AA14337_2970 [Acetobacter malorum DSM 14337]|uniref:Uncharacterized protein n=1 Tax=Acetobacter malorum DSM 14337 TaxID=1307910 RepID=A0ABQ0PYT2_9PROT|nr:hypothetical protein [Acetobacter malorum]KXV06732.1 hypothetical protein AD930_06415 [Acetobacter malorum]GBQ85009.1 hypothetical protein AA14337_2970 [Acetobacter malorum DSM 14337]